MCGVKFNSRKEATREHVIPSHFLNSLTNGNLVRASSNPSGSAQTFAKSGNFVLRVVCAKCNNEWMKDMEEDYIEIVKSGKTLWSDNDIDKLKRWATKFSILVDYDVQGGRWSKAEIDRYRNNKNTKARVFVSRSSVAYDTPRLFHRFTSHSSTIVFSYGHYSFFIYEGSVKFKKLKWLTPLQRQNGLLTKDISINFVESGNLNQAILSPDIADELMLNILTISRPQQWYWSLKTQKDHYPFLLVGERPGPNQAIQKLNDKKKLHTHPALNQDDQFNQQKRYPLMMLVAGYLFKATPSHQRKIYYHAESSLVKTSLQNNRIVISVYRPCELSDYFQWTTSTNLIGAKLDYYRAPYVKEVTDLG